MENKQQPKKPVKLTSRYYIHPLFSNYAASKKGVIINVKTRKEMKPRVHSKTGYYSIYIYDDQLDKPKNHHWHRFVYEAIKGEIPEGLEIDHINEIKSDNRLKNLELVSHQKNIELSKSKKVCSKNLLTKEKRIFESLTKASLELQILLQYSIINFKYLQ